MKVAVATTQDLFVRGGGATSHAEGLARVIQSEVRDRLTDEILFGALENGGTVTIGLEGAELTFKFA